MVIMGSNMAECHPVAFRWPMKAKLNGAKLIHIDPRFTRTSAVADLYVPLRAGSDIAFLGGLINYVLSSERWNTDPFFRDYVVNYTNAATLINEEFRDTEDLQGSFSGLMQYDEPAFWPYNGFVGTYVTDSWQYDRGAGRPGPTFGTQGQMAAGRPAPTAQSGETPAGRGPGTPGTSTRPGGAQQTGPGYDDLVRSLRQPPPRTDPTLRDPRCVLQIVRRHYARYSPELVEQVCGTPREKFLKVAELL